MNEAIAIVGSACRFPGGASSPSKLWDLLRDPRDVLGHLGEDRLNLSRFYNANGEHHGSTDVKDGRAYLLSEDHRRFDAAFFNINPAEADGMDPQQRIILEVVYEALESAGWSLDRVRGSNTSVHVGVMTGDFADIQLRDPETLPTYNSTGTARSILSNRISYFFDINGPSVTIDTACSSSLVALHQAVQGIRTGDATTAIVAGANLILDTGMYIAESSLHMLSPDSRSRMWDKSANGYARGEGFAALVLKPLSAAVADGDHVQAVVRGTGVNSDGRTRGITMPSSSAQTALIQQTYRRAGLNPLDARDRCHFFEAHGTGTLAGDPVEAQAIRDAFFPPTPTATATLTTTTTDDHEAEPRTGSLFVGSIKTVIGHLEGCAGLAGVLKAVLSIQNRSIPPNLLFKELNPAVAPFYDHLKVPTTLIPWPETGPGPLRASVNSFGFGGTNAHVIIESYAPPSATATPTGRLNGGKDTLVSPSDDVFVGPLVFSAHTDSSLLANVKAFSEHIRSNPDIDLEDLASALQTKRTSFPVKKFFSGATRQRLLDFMESFAVDCDSSPNSAVGTRAQLMNTDEKPGVLGVFTGQGAQWASMGKGLITSSQVFRESIEKCEAHLSALPNQDVPIWSLKDELMASEPSSRLSEALLSQPLCTALQIALVDLIKHTGIHLDAVVGHSSGEIAAAYYAGIFDSKAAMEIAYYRGYYAKLAGGLEGQAGRMMAVGLSYDDAEALCNHPQFAGCISVAASNSPMSSTVSGDMAAIEAARAHLDSKKIFARILKTDTAYHSHHMMPCAGPYLKSLRNCNIEIHEPRSDCVWISSVRGNATLLEDDLSELKDQYWVDNMCKPVLFSHAIEASIWNGGPFELALEFGPHPALKGPVEQTFKASFGHAPAYAGLIRRGDSEVEAFSGAIGYAWSHLGPGFIDFDGYRHAFQHLQWRKPQVLQGLPSYSWDHARVHWRESRISRNYRLRNDQGHELLGRRVPDDSDDSMRWRNVLRLAEIPWLRGHVFQGQFLFPGAGYVAMALEAARAMATVDGRPVQLFELQDVVLSRAIVIPDGPGGIEMAFTATKLNSAQGPNKTSDEDVLLAEFSCYFCPDEVRGDLVKACQGTFIIHFGGPSPDVLPPRLPQAPGLVPVDMARFYEALGKVGLNYTHLFNRLVGGHRSLGASSVTASWPTSEAGGLYVIHPAILDVAFQSIYVAFAAPGSDDIWAPYLPVRIRRLAVIPNLGSDLGEQHVDMKMEADAFLDTGSSTLLQGDINLSGPNSNFTGLQVEGIAMQAVSEPGPDNDKLIFSETIWGLDMCSGLTALRDTKQVADDIPLIEALDRTALFYWKTLVQEVTADEIKSAKWYHQRMFAAIHAMLDLTRMSLHTIAQATWLDDDNETISTLSQPYDHRVDMQLIHAVGQNLASVVRGETQQLEVMVQDDMLNRFYMEGYGFSVINDAVASALKQISFKHPNAKILEIGAGTGGTTRSILDAIGSKFDSYTYTDISPAFFKNAAEKFRDHRSKINFRILDVEKSVDQQGFEEHSFDVLVAANVLHATRNLKETMENARALLKPGGYLVMMEITGLEVLRTQFIMGGLPGWWYGVNDGRVLSPAIPLLEWDSLLQDTGFSGVDHSLCDMVDTEKSSFSLIVSQAVDNTVNMLRNPLSSISLLPPREVLIIGGSTLPVARLSRNVKKQLSAFKKVTVASSIDDVQPAHLSPMVSVICLQDLERPVFSQSVTESRLSSLQELFANAKHILWVSNGGDESSPYSNMSVGLGRALWNEIPDLTLQFVDMDATRSPAASAATLAGMFLQLMIASQHTSGSAKSENLLWTVEPEVRIDGEYRYMPRIVPNVGMNDTYNAVRRQILKTVPHHDTCVELVTVNGSSRLREGDALPKESAPGHLRVRVQYTYQLKSADKNLRFLCVGTKVGTESLVLFISSMNASLVDIPEAAAVTMDGTDAHVPALLQEIADQLVAMCIQSLVSEGQTVVVHEPSPSVAEHLSSQTNHVFLTCGDKDGPGWIRVHPMASRRTIQSSLPKSFVFVDISGAVTPRIKSCLPAWCKIVQVSARSIDVNMLRNAYLAATCNNSCDREVSPENDPAQSRITDWNSNRHLQVNIQPLKTAGILSKDKTYVLAGMTGDLGLSLSRWMARNGARHIVLISRKADVDQRWLDDLSRERVQVEVFRADMTEKNSVRAVVDKIRSTMPPVAGVCNGCMVLSDKLFMDLDPNSLATVLGPKVESTRHLDEVFQDTPLDFFILLSSLASVIGNAGQSNYHAANLYMAGLASQRRLVRGRAASVIHIGLVSDLGYVTRQARSVEDKLLRLFFKPLTESDIHHAFAEAIAAGKPDSGRQHELILGLKHFVDTGDTNERPPWEYNPRFSHFVSHAVAKEKKSRGTGGDATIVKQAMDEAESEEVVISLVRKAFARKLESMMQMTPDSVNINIPLIDLGCDSLLAIEIRGWFLKELGMDVPVLKVLSGDTVAQLCDDPTRRFLAKRLQEAASASEVTSKTASAGTSKVPSLILDDTSSGAGDSDSIPEDPLDEKAGPEQNTFQLPLDCDIKHPPEAAPLSRPDEKIVEQADDMPERDLKRSAQASYSQSRLWFLIKYLDDPTNYNVTVSYKVSGRLSIPLIKRALATTISRHESLQTRFCEQADTGILEQQVLASLSYDLKIVQTGDEATVQAEYERLKNRVWDLEHGPLFGVSIVSDRDSDYSTIIFGYHHIIMDGVSWHIFLRDLDTAYQMRPLGTGTPEYIEFSQQQIHDASSGQFDSELQFWRDQHTSLPSVMPLLPIAQTTTNGRQPLKAYRSFISSRKLDQDLVVSIRQASRRLQVTPFHVHLAAIQILFSRLLNLQDLSIGVADANRTDESYADTVGFLLNLLPMRFQVQPEESLRSLVQGTSRKVFAAISNSHVPFDLVLDALKVPRFSDHSPLFQIAVNYRMGALLQRPLGNLMLDLASADDARNPYDIGFGITDSSDGTCVLELTTQSQLYTKEASKLLLDVYVGLVKTLVTADETVHIKDIAIGDADMVRQAVSLGQGSRRQYDWPSTLPQRFQDIAQSHSQDTAIICGVVRLTYSKLAAKVDGIAGSLSGKGLAAGSRVAVLCEPSCASVIAMLAIMHAGYVYVPLDTRIPHSRHLVMVDACKPALLLCHSKTHVAALDLSYAHSAGVDVLDIDTVDEAHAASTHPVGSNEPAVILFTSGTTGVPKGIVLSHRNLVNHLALKTEQLAIGQEVVLQQSSLGFDMSIIQAFCALGNGGTLVMAEKDIRGDPVELSKLIMEAGVTFTIATPSEYQMMFRYGLDSLELAHNWRQACMGGETVTDKVMSAFRTLNQPAMRVTNCYGPTEITAAATFETLPLADEEGSGIGELPGIVGKALPNYSIYILDENNQVLPVGVGGEICIGGAGVAKGYLNLPEQTAARFLPDPYASTEDVARGWSTMYRTGDRGRLLPDGRLVFLGRVDGDSQVKLRGLRIELNDVASTIITSGRGLISDAVVTVRDQGPETTQFLVAHVVLEQGKTSDSKVLQQLLAALPLPQYMIPSMIIPLKRLPMTANGKVDRRALAATPLPKKEGTEEGAAQPTKRLTLSEGELRLLWEMVLPTSTSPLGPDSDFFMCGGSSILLVQLQGLIKASIEISISIRELYQASTLGRMAALVGSLRAQNTPSGVIDWVAETTAIPPMPSIPAAAAATTEQTQRQSSDLQVLMTGSGGFLGSAILASLVVNPRVRKIHCVAVSPVKVPSHSLHDKITIYAGSLAAPSLGLSRSDCSELQSCIDFIIHAGANGHCLNNYSSICAPNVHSTRFLASLALPRAVPIHYISSNRVTLLSDSGKTRSASPPTSVSACFPPTDGSEGFTATKWASERLLENTARQTGLAVCIHRPCAVTGAEAPSEDALNALIRYSRLLRAVPRFENFEGYLDFRDVYEVADGIVSDALENVAEDHELRFIHYSSGQKVEFKDFGRHMSSHFGTQFEELAVSEWIDRALEHGIDPLITGYLEAMTERKEIIRFPYMGESGVYLASSGSSSGW